MTRYATMFLFLAFLPCRSMARAGEADDLQRQIDYLKQTTTDLERQDDQKAVVQRHHDDARVAGQRLDPAIQEKYDEVRIVLDRCEAQANMVRQRLTASKLSAQAAAKEDEVKRARASWRAPRRRSRTPRFRRRAWRARYENAVTGRSAMTTVRFVLPFCACSRPGCFPWAAPRRPSRASSTPSRNCVGSGHAGGAQEGAGLVQEGRQGLWRGHREVAEQRSERVGQPCLARTDLLQPRPGIVRPGQVQRAHRRGRGRACRDRGRA
jgi:hypothetical protein